MPRSQVPEFESITTPAKKRIAIWRNGQGYYWYIGFKGAEQLPRLNIPMLDCRNHWIH